MEKTHRKHIKFGVSTEKRENHERIVSDKACVLSPHKWEEESFDDFPKGMFLRDQNGGSYCGAEAAAGLVESQTGMVVSAHPFYRMRSNFPSLGMSLDDILGNPCKYGTTFEKNDPSNLLNEEKADLPVTMKTPIVASDPHELNVADIEELASACDAYGGIVVTVNIAWDEWDTEQGIPTFIPSAEVSGGHCMFVKKGIIYKNDGKRYLLGKQSWGNDSDSINQSSWVLFSEEFLKNRGTGAGTFKAPSMSPVSLFSSVLREDSRGPDVIRLQTMLRMAKIDGIFGPHTKAEVELFQTLHGLLPDGIVGPRTAAQLSMILLPTISEPITARILRGAADTKEVIGRLSIDGNQFTCRTLEPVNCIPLGEYQCVWSYQYDLNEWHYELQGVNGRYGIFIHEGDFYRDTLGCILLGISPSDINGDGETDVTSSRATLAKFESLTNKKPFRLIIS